MKIGRYRVVRELGCGGMARVTLCESPSGREVVIKRPLKDEPDAYDRLLDEAQSGARITHPHLVETLDFFTEDGVPHLVVGYVPGRSLLEVREAGPLEPSVVLRIGRQIAEGLHAVHTATSSDGVRLGMVHRDISPSNIVLSEQGDACLIDLGIARSSESLSQRTKTGFLRGKVAYLAPELFFGRSYSAASDLWALGMVLFEAAVGRRAVTGGQPEMVAQIVAGRIMELQPGEHIDVLLEGALARLLHPNPEHRVARANEAAALFSMVERELGEDAREATAQAARGRSSPPCVVGTLVEELIEEDEELDLELEGLSDALCATEPLFEPGDCTVRERPRPRSFTDLDPDVCQPISSAPELSLSEPEEGSQERSATVEKGPLPPVYDVNPSDWLHGTRTRLFSELGGPSTRLLPLPSESDDTSPKDRLLHYVAELRELTHPREKRPPPPPMADPWAMDSSPGH